MTKEEPITFKFNRDALPKDAYDPEFLMGILAYIASVDISITAERYRNLPDQYKKYWKAV